MKILASAVKGTKTTSYLFCTNFKLYAFFFITTPGTQTKAVSAVIDLLCSSPVPENNFQKLLMATHITSAAPILGKCLSELSIP